MERKRSASKKRKKSATEGIYNIYFGPTVNNLCVLRNSEKVTKTEDMTWSKDLISLVPRQDTTFEGRYSVFLPDHNIRIPKAPAFRSLAKADVEAFVDRNKFPKQRAKGLHDYYRPPKYLQKLSDEDVRISSERLSRATATSETRSKLVGQQRMVLPDIKTRTRLNSSGSEN